MPYFWGTFGLMYNKQLEIFEDKQTWDTKDMDNPILLSELPDGHPDILQRNNAWKIFFFDETADEVLPTSIRVGQYSAVRFTYGAVMTYLDGTPNTPVNDGIERFRETLSRRKYTQWAADELKHSIEAHEIDMAFAYTGDCLDMVYLRFLERGLTYETLDFFTYAPTETMAHIDALVIPKNARHADLARKFINFLLIPDNAWLNNRDIGYLPPLQQVYDMIVTKSAPDVSKDSYLYFDATEEEEMFWRENWAKAIQAIEPREGMDLTPFSYFETEDINRLNNIVNNIKVSK
jgi:spermidine/putrescine-binding protein